MYQLRSSLWFSSIGMMVLLVIISITIIRSQSQPAEPNKSTPPVDSQLPADHHHPPPLTVVTHNINWGNQALHETIDLILQTNADIVALQETTVEFESLIEQHLAQHYPHRTFFGHDGNYYAERMGILSRYPLDRVEFHPPVAGVFGFLHTTITVEHTPIQLINVHLEPFELTSQVGMWQLLQAMMKTENVHRLEVDSILSTVDDNLPTLIVGDFNSMPAHVAPQTMLTQGFQDSFTLTHENPEQFPTWNWVVGEINLTARIDYIFHDSRWSTNASWINDNPHSDHVLLISKLTLHK